MKNKSYFYVGATALILGFFLLGAKWYKKSQNDSLSFLAEKNAGVFVRDYSPRYGNPDAKVFLIEFLDPECESCRAFYPHVKKLLSEYEGKVQLVVRYAAYHGNSKTVIRALEATRSQGKYWESLEHLFKIQPQWGSHHNPKVELIFDFLPAVGVDVIKLRKDMNASEIENIIDQDAKDLKTLGVRGTPTFFVNGKKPSEFSFKALKSLIQDEVDKAYPEE